MWLRRYQAGRMNDCPYLFTTERSPIRRLMPHQLWYLVKASVPEQVPGNGSGRTDCAMLATTLLNSGADLVAVQSIHGREEPETTQICATMTV